MSEYTAAQFLRLKGKIEENANLFAKIGGLNHGGLEKERKEKTEKMSFGKLSLTFFYKMLF